MKQRSILLASGFCFSEVVRKCVVAKDLTLRIQVSLRKGLPLHSYSKDGIGTLNPIVGRGLDSLGK